MATTSVKQGDLFPDVEHTILDENDDPVAVTGATITFSLWRARGKELILDAEAAEIVDGPNGQVSYRWKSGETEIEPGTYECEFRVTPAGGGGDPYRATTV